MLLFCNAVDFHQVPLSQRFNPDKKHKSSSWWSYFGFGSASNTVSTDYEGVMDEGSLVVINTEPAFIQAFITPGIADDFFFFWGRGGHYFANLCTHIYITFGWLT